VEKLTLSNISLADLKRIVKLQEKGIGKHSWTQVADILLDDREQQRITDLERTLTADPVHLLNEATIWSRAIYPLLQLAERNDIRALAGVPLQASYPQFILDGIADGVMGRSVIGRIDFPYLVMVEAKRGIEGQNPVAQLYGELLAAARLNWENLPYAPQEVFGCYTIADSWTFVRATVADVDTDRPLLTTEHSQEYTQKTDAATILRTLKSIINHGLQQVGIHQVEVEA
jgi:hypothetical protein